MNHNTLGIPPNPTRLASHQIQHLAYTKSSMFGILPNSTHIPSNPTHLTSHHIQAPTEGLHACLMVCGKVDKKQTSEGSILIPLYFGCVSCLQCSVHLGLVKRLLALKTDTLTGRHENQNAVRDCLVWQQYQPVRVRTRTWGWLGCAGLQHLPA